MRIAEKLVGLSLLALLAACSSLNPFATKDSKTQPAKLVELKSSIAVHKAWSASIGKAGVYTFNPAFANDSIFIASAEGSLVRLDMTNGHEQWRVKTGFDFTAGVGSDGNYVVVGAAKGVVLAFDGTGKLLWQQQASSEILSAPVVGEGVAVVRSVDNRIIGFDAKTGAKKWTLQRSVPALTLRNAPGMVVGGASVYIALPGGKLLAVALASGATRWEATVGEPRGATELERVSDIAGTPVLFDKDICTVSYQGKVGCFDAATGVPRWLKSFSSSVSVAIDQRFVFAADENGALAAFSREGGQSAWKNDLLAFRRLSSPLSYGRAVAVGDFEGYIHFLSREDGALIGRVSTDGSPIISVPFVAGANLIFQTQSGTVTALAVE